MMTRNAAKTRQRGIIQLKKNIGTKTVAQILHSSSVDSTLDIY